MKPRVASRKAGAPSLATWQRTIAATVMRPLAPDDTMAPEAMDVAAKLVRPNDRLKAFDRLQIYNQQYWWRLLAAFAEDFRGLHAVLGERKFDRLAHAYLASHPSASWTLRNLGSRLVAFLESHPEFTAPRTALALDVARVEWARVIAFDGPEKPVIDPAWVATVSPTRLRLGLQPYVSLLALAHPIDELMRRLKRTETAAMSNAVAATHGARRSRVGVRRQRRPIHLAVHRMEGSVYYKRLDLEAWRLLTALRDGATVASACAGAFADATDLPERHAARIHEWFTRWMEFGWFCRRSPGRNSALRIIAPC